MAVRGAAAPEKRAVARVHAGRRGRGGGIRRESSESSGSEEARGEAAPREGAVAGARGQRQRARLGAAAPSKGAAAQARDGRGRGGGNSAATPRHRRAAHSVMAPSL